MDNVKLSEKQKEVKKRRKFRAPKTTIMEMPGCGSERLIYEVGPFGRWTFIGRK
jgi:hypothetical protein